MGDLYKNLMNSVFVSLASITLFGCTQPTTPGYDRDISDQKAYFDNWGPLGEPYRGVSQEENYEIRLGDIDGDGDLDIIIGKDSSRVRIYENRIPQE